MATKRPGKKFRNNALTKKQFECFQGQMTITTDIDAAKKVARGLHPRKIVR